MRKLPCYDCIKMSDIGYCSEAKEYLLNGYAKYYHSQRCKTEKNKIATAKVVALNAKVNLKVICVIPALPSELNMATLKSVLTQTTPVEYIYLLSKHITEGKSVPQKISIVLNDGFEGLQLSKFDYILRLDADTVLPPDFVEKHLALNVDAAGGAGYAMLIKTSKFMELCHGKFNSESDDSYIYHKFKAEGKPVSPLLYTVKHKPPGALHNQLNYWVNDGKLSYMIGYVPHQVFAHIRLKKPQSYFQALGYFKALFSFKKTFEFAKQNRVKFLKEPWLRNYITKASRLISK